MNGCRFELSVAIDRWPLRRPFRTAVTSDTDSETVTVTLTSNGSVGRGEASGIFFRGETAATVASQIEGVRQELESGVARCDLATLLPAGGARNAVDCAMWDWQSRHTGTPVWELAGCPVPQPVQTTVTIGIDTPEEMAIQAREWASFQAIKMKLDGDDEDADRIRAVRATRPDAILIIDGNQGFSQQSLAALLPTLIDAGVTSIEQPLPIGEDKALDAFDVPIAFIADESVCTSADLDNLPSAYGIINIKLDKAGGLTGALELARRGRAQGRRVMVGNMVGTSLAMVPAWIAGHGAQFVDLDGPLLLARDRKPAMRYENGRVSAPDDLWGFAA